MVDCGRPAPVVRTRWSEVSDWLTTRLLRSECMTDAEAAIRELFQAYLDFYNRLEPEALAALHATPSSIVHRGQVLIMDDETKVPYHKSILAENAAAGDHVWEMADLKIDQVAPNGAVAKLHWIARRPDGSVLWEDRPAYVVADDGNGWRIWSNISSNAY